jgi:predicted RNA binding protein YcfA (HicA-like mRNA interferase family)
MTKIDKRHNRIVNNPKNVDFDELRTWLSDSGFKLDHVTGSHHFFVHKKSGKVLNVQPDKSGKAKAYQVKQAIALIEAIK